MIVAVCVCRNDYSNDNPLYCNFQAL